MGSRIEDENKYGGADPVGSLNYFAIIRDKMNYRKHVIPILLVWLCGFFIATYAPITVLTDNWMARKYVSMMSFIATPLGKAATRSSFPEVSALYYSIIWWSFPWLLLIAWKWANSQISVSKTGILFKKKLSILDRFVLLMLVPLWLFLVYVAFSLNQGGDVRMFSFGVSRLQLGIFGMAIPLGAAIALVTALFSIKRIFSINERENDHGDGG